GRRVVRAHRRQCGKDRPARASQIEGRARFPDSTASNRYLACKVLCMRIRLFLQFAVVVLLSTAVLAEPLPVRFAEGIVHGFLSLRTVDGALVANGDLIQVARGDRVTSRLVFHSNDGSLRDETSVFSQRQSFRLISNHLVQKGPTFPQSLDLRIACASGQVTVHYTDDHGKEKVESERMKLPPDLANGITLTLLKNISA